MKSSLNGHARASHASRPSRRLRVLVVAKRFPYPPDTGGKIRTARLLEHLAAHLDMTLVTNVEHPKDEPYLPGLERLGIRVEDVPWQEVPKGSPRFYLNVLRRLATRYPVSVAGDYSAPFAERIRTCLAREPWDLVLCDFVQPSINLDRRMAYPTLLFQHNVESMIFERHARTASNPLVRRFWRSQWRKMERFERDACRWFTGVVAVSEADRAVFAERFGAQRTFVIPTAVDAEYFKPSPTPVVDGRIVFTGSMDWLPNEDAIVFFAEEILPRILARVPGATLTVVGRSPSPSLQRRLAAHPAVTLTGRVDDVRPYVAEAAVYVIPLRIGGGTRIKAYEAMAMGKAMVSTPIGIEGLPLRNGENFVEAERGTDFADAVIDLLENAGRRRQLGESARRFVETSCSWANAAEAFVAACRGVMAGGPQHSKAADVSAR